jgi:hypothetical protein
VGDGGAALKDIEPHFFADITLYSSENGGRKSPITADWFGCPAKLHEQDHSGFSFRILTRGERFAPGETKRFGVVFLVPEAAALLTVLPKFYLWEGHIIGEAIPVSSNESLPQLKSGSE